VSRFLKLVTSILLGSTALSINLSDPCAFAADARSQAHYERPAAKGGPYKDRIIVFVHGLFGDADSTWRSSTSAYWPKLLLGDDAFRDFDIYVAGYSSPYLGNRMNVDEVVANLNSRLVSDDVFSKHREVIFVCHSLGGLIVQRLLLTFRGYASKVPFVYFFATPQTGSDMARLATVFDADPLLKALLPGDQNEYLQNLENEWKASHFRIQRLCAYEKNPYKGILVVDRLSGTRNCDEPPIAINENHLGIVKPDSTEHDSYIALRNAIRALPTLRTHHADHRSIDPRASKQTPTMPNASDLASAIVQETRIRDAFERERNKPVAGMYAIISLAKPLRQGGLGSAAGIVQIADTVAEERPALSFGWRTDYEKSTLIGGGHQDQEIDLKGVRSEVWSTPRNITPDTLPQNLDSMFVFGFDWLDRLECGATGVKVPFSKVDDLDHGSLQLKLAPGLIDLFDHLTLVVNDFVIFELRKSDILGWRPPASPINAQVAQGHLDAGRVVLDRVVKSSTLSPNDTLPHEFQQFPFFTAVVAPIKEGPSFDSYWSPIKLSEFDVRIHHVMGGVFDHKAGNESRTVQSGEHGWLLAEPPTVDRPKPEALEAAASQPHIVHITSQRNEFQVPHNLGCDPSYAEIQMTSRGLMQWQAPNKKYDRTYLYLDASDDGLTADVLVWCRR